MINTAKRAGDGLTINGGGMWLADTHPAVIDYFDNGGIVEDEFTQEELDAQAASQRLSELEATDKDMARIIEDIYDYLELSDPEFAAAMPQSVKDKVANRKAKRAAL